MIEPIKKNIEIQYGTAKDAKPKANEYKVTALTLIFGACAVGSFVWRAFTMQLDDWYDWVDCFFVVISIVVFTLLLVVRCRLLIQRKREGANKTCEATRNNVLP
jgi:hypothetical protein